MRSFLIKISLPVTALIVLYALNAWYSVSPQAAPAVVGTSPAPQSIGPLTFGSDGTLFAADNQAALLFALDLGRQDGAVGGLKDIPSIDQKIASTLGTSAGEISITDLAVHPRSHNAFLSIRRGRGADAKPALIRIDGNGAIGLVPFDGMNYSSVGLPDAPTGFRAGARAEFVTDMALVDDRLWVAGLSNEEFSSKLRSVSYPFNAVDHGASVEIFHGSHGQFETSSPVYTFVPFSIGGEPYLIASYLCTPLVKFPMASLKPGGKIRGVTIAELGNGNRPLDMIAYKKDGRDYLLMSNDSRGVMKIPAETFANATPITAPVKSEKAGIAYESVSRLRGVEQLDLLDSENLVLLTRGSNGLDLRVAPLP